MLSSFILGLKMQNFKNQYYQNVCITITNERKILLSLCNCQASKECSLYSQVVEVYV